MGKKKGQKFTPLDPEKMAAGPSGAQQQQGAQQPPAGDQAAGPPSGSQQQQPQGSREQPGGAQGGQMQATKKQKTKGGGQQPQQGGTGDPSQQVPVQVQQQPGGGGDGGGKGKKKKGGQQQQQQQQKQSGQAPPQGAQPQQQQKQSGRAPPQATQSQPQPGMAPQHTQGGPMPQGAPQQQQGWRGQAQQPQQVAPAQPQHEQRGPQQLPPGMAPEYMQGGPMPQGAPQQQVWQGQAQQLPPGMAPQYMQGGPMPQGAPHQQVWQGQAQQLPPGMAPQYMQGGPMPQGAPQQQVWQGQAQQLPPGMAPQYMQGGPMPQGAPQQQGWRGQAQQLPQGIAPQYAQGGPLPQGAPQQQQGWRGQAQQPQQVAPVQPQVQQPQQVAQSQQEQRGPQQQRRGQQQTGPQPQGGRTQQQVGRGQQQPGGPQPQGGPGQQQPGGPQQQGGKGRGKQPAGKSQEQGKSPQSTPSRSSSVSSVASLPAQAAKLSISQPRPAGSGDAELVRTSRVNPGTRGRKIRVESNHLELNLGTLKEAYHYDVAIDPNTPKKFLRPVMEAFRKKHFPNRYPAFDGMKNIYASKPLSANLNDLIADTIVLPTDDGRDKTFKVEVKYANTVDLRPLRDFLSHAATPQEALQCVDVVLRSAPVATCLPVGRSFFLKPDRIIDLGQGMEMYNGFYQSAIRGWKPLLNVDVAHKAFPKAMPVIDALCEVLTQNPKSPFTRENLGRGLQDYQSEIFRKFITTLRVTYEIPGHPGTKRGYRVNGIDKCARDKTFTHEGRSLTIADYFSRIKNYRLRYPELPTLWVGSLQRVDRVLLPLELCYINEGQAVNRKMTENQTSNMIRYAATNTDVRKQKIMRGVQTAQYNKHPCVQEFGFSVGSEFQKLEARVLQPPELAYANRKVRPSRGVWRNDRFLEGITVNNWTIANVNRYPPRGDDLPNMARMIRRHASECGMNFTTDAVQPFVNIAGRQGLKDIEQYFKTQKQKNFDIIFVVVPDSGPQYSYVKSAAELNVGCLTQCIKSRTLGRMNPQTVVNILLKVNSKLNGKNHCLNTRPQIMARPVMIMGADVTHPSPDSVNIPSVAAVTASHDPKAFQYNICWRLQPPKVEIIEDLEAIVMEQLKFFYTKTKIKPEAIVFFRDGVSEGQFEQVKNAEIRAIRAACKRLQADGYEPKITFLVVQKRHHTRLFPMDPRDSEDKNMNVPAGTCVDTTITHPYMQDFYLVSHASIQGVAKPTKYCTLWDDNNMDNDQVEELTYYLCHMFTRCNRSVSYPAPTYYAHLAAARAKVYIENDNLNLSRLQDEFMKYQIRDEIRKQLPMFFV